MRRTGKTSPLPTMGMLTSGTSKAGRPDDAAAEPVAPVAQPPSPTAVAATDVPKKCLLSICLSPCRRSVSCAQVGGLHGRVVAQLRRFAVHRDAPVLQHVGI